MNQYTENIVDAITRVADDGEQFQRIKTLSAELGWASDDEIDDLLVRIIDLQVQLQDTTGAQNQPNLSAVESGLEILFARLIHDLRQRDDSGLSTGRIDLISRLYHHMPPSSSIRSYLLGWLSSSDDEQALRHFTELLVNDPPQSSVSIAVAFAPLVNASRNYPLEVLFPQLLGALQHISVAAAVLDLANFAKRTRQMDRHPAADHLDQLMRILEMLTQRLTKIESGEIPQNWRPGQISQIVGESVSLVTSLCDALSLIGDKTAVETLRQASLLKHRRLRTETLSALCQLGESSAAGPLIGLAAEPVVRMRVLAYAEELGMLEQVPDAWKSPPARAEGQLAMWLAHPSNMGLAPNELQLVESRQLIWPSYEDPQQCYLFRYGYELSGEKIENVGIAGPMTHAFTSSLLHLDLADVYACFAGWQCDHEEIQEWTIQQATAQMPGTIERLMARLASWSRDESAVLDAQPSFLGIFFGEPVLVATGQHNDQPGTFVVDTQDVHWFESGRAASNAVDELVFCIYKGRKLLGAFNSAETWPG